MTGTELKSCAAIAKLTVPSTIQSTDPLLCLIVSLLNPNQLEVVVAKSGKSKKAPPPQIQLEIQEQTKVLTQRNAILRSITGIDLHSILDSGYFNVYLQGGHSVAASYGNKNLASSAVLASISSWMSVASTLKSYEKIQELMDYLDSASVLGKQSFLLETGFTLADLDVYFAIRQFVSKDEKWSDWLIQNTGPNVQRWWDCIQCTVLNLKSSDQRKNKLLADVPPLYFEKITYPAIMKAKSTAAVFYYGDEGEVIPEPKVSVSQPKTKAKSSSTPTPTPTPPKAATTAAPGGLTEEQKKAANEKRAKKKAAKASNKKNTGGAAPAAELNISALDIRVGKIVKVWNHETAEKLYCEEVDVGEPSGPRKIASGLRPFYSLEDMQQDHFILVLCNLKARNLVGFPSHGMVLCASNADHTKVEFVTAPKGAKVGDRVLFESYEKGDPEAENKVAKKKIFEKLAPDLKTDENGIVVWKGKKSIVGEGQCHAINGMPNAQVS